MLTPRVPRALLTTNRTEHTDLSLTVVEGALPADLTGHLYIIAPASTAVPGAETTLLVGDGLLCRFDLSPNAVALTTRLIRSPDEVADEITAKDKSLSMYRFHNLGIARLGALGVRNFSNTACIPMPFSSGPTRLAVTYDAGRPIEVDPKTMAFATHIGARDEWDAEALPDAAFPMVLSPAHPFFDPHTDELFTLGYGRGVVNFAKTIPLMAVLAAFPPALVAGFDKFATVIGADRAFRWLVEQVRIAATDLDIGADELLSQVMPDIVPDSFTDLVRWDGEGRLERFRILLPDGREVHVQQSVHQIAATRDHILILETGFKIGLQSTFDNPLPNSDVFERLARLLLTRRQKPRTIFYVVARKDLDAASQQGPYPPRVTCQRVSIPVEADHFLADYDEPGGKITVHVGHAPATDLSEWIRAYDVSAYDGAPIDPALRGMLAVGAMDVGRLGRYTIDPVSAAVQSSKTVCDTRNTWAVALYAGRAINTPAPPPDKIEQLYWCTEGVFPELLTEFVKDLYYNYEHRVVDVETILAMGTTGRPSAVHRLDTATMKLADTYELPAGIMAGSLQFVPRAAGGPTDGYLIGTMYTDPRTELWIFDAADLKSGPIAKLAAPEWKVGFSLHTAWLPMIEARAAAYKVSVRDELENIAALSAALETRFAQDLYPLFD
ncbi:MAG TPA: hypothetical protein ENK57_15665 [Polyangiaceae bacterium]|nr:hypothetical protein [Polyangiaceae bacterium]